MIFYNSCSKCVNFAERKRCLAFPDGIPDDIWTMKNDHTVSTGNDNGITFEPIDTEPTKHQSQGNQSPK